MSTSTTISTPRSEVVGLTSLSYMRSRTLRFDVKDVKPLTKFYAFFDDTPVSEYCNHPGSGIGTQLVSDSAGRLSGEFNLPDRKFNTGVKIFKLLDVNTPLPSTIPGSKISSAAAEYTSTGWKLTKQETIDSVTTIVNTKNIELYGPNAGEEVVTSCLGDPLAQTFFTYGVVGGCFVTSIELFFQSKDASIPVTVELRKVQNGYPAFDLINKYAKVSLSPAYVKVSDDASASTMFVFDRPIQLEADSDYCFVILSNSNSYNMYTSELGQKSIETGAVIFEQPFIGTLFKSENNKTWTAEQTQDVKFTLYKAVFDQTERTLTANVTNQSMTIYGSYFSAVSGSSIIQITNKSKHGLLTGDRIAISGVPSTVYRGIPVTAFTSSLGYVITKIDDYSYTFNCLTAATSTGVLDTCGKIVRVDIDYGGGGYTNPTLTVIGNGTGAELTAVVEAGVIVDVIIVNAGTGYTSAPIVTVEDSGGSFGVGAVIMPIATATFVLSINRNFQEVNPAITSTVFTGAELKAQIKTTESTSRIIGQYDKIGMNEQKLLVKNAVLMSHLNQTVTLGGNPSTQIEIKASTNNSNISPIIYMNENPRLRFRNYIVNDVISNPYTVLDPASELLPTGGQSESKYLSSQFTVLTVSNGARIVVTAMATVNSNFNLYFRSSMTGASTPHYELNWVLMECETDTNLSRKRTDLIEYVFELQGIPEFDTYDIKIVLSADNEYEFPEIEDYRVILTSS